jgi:hypothetical protein
MMIRLARKTFLLAATLVALAFAVGCSHPLQVTNIRSYQSLTLTSLDRPCTVGIVPLTDDFEGRRLIRNVGSALAQESATVVLPYQPKSAEKPDVVVRIAIYPEYCGSNQNFLVTWPGFVVWAPAWHGYAYRADFSASVRLSKGTDDSPVEEWKIPVKLDIRHAEIDRSWTEIGWLTTGAIPFAAAFWFVEYDHDVTAPLMDKVERPVGEYIARQIIDRINSSGMLATE